MKTLIVGMFWFAVVVQKTLASEPAGPVTVSPEFVARLAEVMRTNSPALRAMRERTNAAAAELGAVRTWADPMLMLGGMASERGMRAEDGDLIYGVEQKLPLFGVATAQRKVSRAELDVAVAREDAEFQTRRVELAVALFRAALADELLGFGEEDLRGLALLRDAAEARYRSGEGTLAEWLQVQNEHAKRAVALQAERDRRTQQLAAINRLLGRPLTNDWPGFKLPSPAGEVRYSPVLARFASTYEPRLRALRMESFAASTVAERTRRDRFPEISAAVESRNYSGNGEFRQADVLLRMSLPWFNRNKQRNAELRDEAKARAAGSDAAAYEAELQEEIFRLVLKIASSRREALAYRDEIIPRSEAVVQSSRVAWESGRGMFRDVLESRRMFVESRMMFARAVTEQYEMLSDLVLCCGLGDLEALQMIGAQSESLNGGTKP